MESNPYVRFISPIETSTNAGWTDQRRHVRRFKRDFQAMLIWLLVAACMSVISSKWATVDEFDAVQDHAEFTWADIPLFVVSGICTLISAQILLILCLQVKKKILQLFDSFSCTFCICLFAYYSTC